jgi:uncharacterized protein YcfJ
MEKRAPILFALTAFALVVTTASAQAANCQGRRDTGTAVGAIGGGLVGNAASRGSAGGTIAGAVIGGVAGNLIGGNNCGNSHSARFERRRHYDKRGVAFYYDRQGHRHYYR